MKKKCPRRECGGLAVPIIVYHVGETMSSEIQYKCINCARIWDKHSVFEEYESRWIKYGFKPAKRALPIKDSWLPPEVMITAAEACRKFLDVGPGDIQVIYIDDKKLVMDSRRFGFPTMLLGNLIVWTGHTEKLIGGLRDPVKFCRELMATAQ